MRIALTYPWCWPEVQRGSERLFADLVDYLAGAGHDVLAVSAGAVPTVRTTAAGARQNVVRAREGGWTTRHLRLDRSVTYLPSAARVVRRFEPDVFHGMYHLDGVAGRLARCRRRLVHVQGIPRRGSLAGRPIQRQLLRLSMATPTQVIAVSRAAADVLEAEFGYQARVLYNGVNIAPFVEAGLVAKPSDEPSVLFPSAPGDTRKRLDVLVRAMNLAAPQWPGLRLTVAAIAPDDVMRRVESESRVPVQWLANVSPDGMPKAYATTWVTCAPAVREAFGLVFIESMAAGAPAVGVRDGGVPEVIPEPRWLAEADDEESLADALDAALRDSQLPDTADRCRAHAATFDWRTRGPAFETLYQEVSGTVRP